MEPVPPSENKGARPAEPLDKALDDYAVFQALEDYVERLQAGRPPDRETFLHSHPQLARVLDCLDALDGIAPVTGPFGPNEDSTIQLSYTADIPREFGDFELLGEIARGGMGVVYKARQLSLNRVVALKMIIAGELAQPSDVERFHTEAQAAAGLHHPNIVSIYDVGQHQGRHYLSMEYVQGESLAQLARHSPLSAKRAARYVKQTAEAVHYAHQHGILHRDLKPSNVLIDALDQARVMDFGLAKRVEGDGGLTATGQALGTPPYMPPEQVSAKRNRIGPASDVYGLGATLYELLTGRPPFRGETPWDTLCQVCETAPVPPRLLNPQTPRDLEKICLKCLEKDPQHRYPSAQALADDLGRFLDGDPISIASVNVIDRLTRALRYGHHDIEFRTWGNMTLLVAWIVLFAHSAVFLASYLNAPGRTSWFGAIRGVELAAIATVMFVYRHDWFPPRGIPARQFWAIWAGYLIGSAVLLAAGHLWATPQRPFDELTIYPQLAVLASLGFIVLGSSYWGYCYVFGAGMLVLAPLMSLFLPWAPLAFGVGLSSCFLLLGLHLRKLAKEA